MRMPCGRYEGKEVSGLSSDYLKWLIENFGDDDVRDEADNEYNRRLDNGEL